MSRVAKIPIVLPDGVDVSISGAEIKIKGGRGELSHSLHPLVDVTMEDKQLKLVARNNSKASRALTGTARAVLQNMVTGVSDGFEIRLNIVGVGYRAAAQGKVLNLTLGFSHPVDVDIPEGITIETPGQTEILVKGADKQKVGQVASDIREFRPPEPYKGKGVRYADENITRKEAKKA